MFGAHDELVRIARVFVVMDQSRDERCEDIETLETFYHLAVGHQVVQTLNRVENVRYTMVGVLFEVAHLKFACEIDEVLQRDVVQAEEILLLEDLECQELKRVLVEHRFEVERVESDGL